MVNPPDPNQTEELTPHEALYCEGIDHYGEGRNAEAERAFREAIALEPKYVNAWEGLAMALAAMDRLDEAIEAAQQLVALDPEAVMPHTTLSMLYVRKGDKQAAEEEAGKARMLSWKAEMKAKRAEQGKAPGAPPASEPDKPA